MRCCHTGGIGATGQFFVNGQFYPSVRDLTDRIVGDGWNRQDDRRWRSVAAIEAEPLPLA